MKVTNINARSDISGKHNDRNFDLNRAKHIDQEKTTENKYYRYNGDENMSFDKLEQQFYEMTFEDYLSALNEHHRPKHPERVKTIEQYRKGKNTRPEDKILQIGNINNHATGEELWACALEYKDRFNDIYGDNCVIIDMALHMDEATPHVHVRRVWIAEDEQGNKHVHQGKALEQLGILPPNPNAPTGQYNNAKITLTQSDTELFRTVCLEHGLDIDVENKSNKKRQRLETREYKVSQDEQKIEEIIREVDHFAEESPHLIEQHKEQLEETKKISDLEHARFLLRIMVREFERLNRSGDFETAYKKERLMRLEKYIEANGLTKDYQEWEQKENQKDYSRE